MHKLIDRGSSKSDDVCEESGCVCQDGLIWNEESESCVRVDQCPCHHAGQSFQEGDVISKDCNTW